MMSENLGTCCACGGTEAVRNIYTLQKKSPTPGKGWGCFQCDQPQDGAVAVVCDACHDSGAPLKFACKGYPGKDGRVPIAELQGIHEHDMSKHQDETAAWN
jgi:hypothetical protein